MFKLGLFFAILTALGLAGYKWLAPSIMDKGRMLLDINFREGSLETKLSILRSWKLWTSSSPSPKKLSNKEMSNDNIPKFPTEKIDPRIHPH
ncbi:uncharacterized protein LOC9317115 isoform X2 [Arabidopsis lyrata subsp. lyrata]|uniref:uncharacterized protein LOC9317115 isoform X2 n=1 Tax=Arabidopsis lyrata subsp. lyrata TaxID=81972 RepID=UPI000A29AC6B|nr:uncharacterized protein LOC9317115 isoform X2 [Arabidopsis lyrata subsp. lyrata]|eukprot:XP_020884007.1 uncharacterized protein LOC9317115 isoform X2 [Arabidopsis lyrata subsp. lyrata]